MRWRGRTRRDTSDEQRGSGGDYLDFADLFGIFDGDSPLAVIGAVLAVIAIVVLAWLFLVPLLLALLDVVVLIVLALVGVAGRVVLHRPWEIEVSGPDQIVSLRVVGWQKSSQAIEEVTRRLRTGRPVPTDVRDLRLE